MSVYLELQRLYDERRELDARIAAAMKARFLGRRVRVNHYRGSYTGVVRGVGWNEFSVVVENDVTGKSTQRWPLLGGADRLPEVELLEGDGND